MLRIGYLGPEGTFTQRAAQINTTNNPAELVGL